MACAVLQRPALLAIDDLDSLAPEVESDPAAVGLPGSVVCLVMPLLSALARSGATVLVSATQPDLMMYPSFDHIIVLSHGRMLYKGPTAAVRTYVDQYLRRAVVTALHDAAVVSAAAPSAIAALPPMTRWCSPFAFFFDLMTRAPYDPASLPRCPSILLHRLQARAQQQARASAYPAFGDNSVVGGANGDLVGGIGQLPRTISADDLGFAVATRGADGQQLLLVPVPPAGAGAVSALDYRFFINELLDEKEVAGSGVLPEMAVCACFCLLYTSDAADE